MSPQFSINILDQIQLRQMCLVGPKILQCHQGVIKRIIKKFACCQSIKALKKKFKIKSGFSRETIKRMINGLDIKKPSGEMSTYFFKKYNFV